MMSKYVELAVYIRLAADGSGITGIGYDDPGLDIKYSINGGEAIPFTPTEESWYEHTSGVYRLRLPVTASPFVDKLLIATIDYPDATTSAHSFRLSPRTPVRYGI